ncbi:MAG: hypothetical protein COA42_23820 [Alteromonadaceae bacterium]|nr:MAG: hypothetical protein COA42_23820 [Alteromonadaceae bacterium]
MGIDKHVPKISDGVFLLLISNSQDSVKYNTLTLVKNTNEPPRFGYKNEYSVTAVPVPGGSNVQMFTGILEPGEYKLSSLSLHVGNARYWLQFGDKSKHTFDIESGAISDLGRIVKTIKKGNSWAGSSMAFRAPNEPDVFSYIEMAMPDVAKSLLASHAKIVPGWKEDADMVEKLWLSIAKITASDFNHPITDHSGTIIAGLRMGQVLKRYNDGTWKMVDTKSNHTIQAVAELPGDKMFVGGEMNKYFIVDEKNNVLEYSSDGLPYGRIVYANYFEGSGLIIAIVNSKGINIYSNQHQVGSQWELIDTIDSTYSLWGELAKLNVVGDGERIYFSRDDDLFVYHVASKEWNANDLPFNTISMAVNGRTIVAKGSYFLEKRSYISEDYGVSWKITNTRSSDSMINVLPSGESFVFSNDSGGMVKFSSDFGSTWYEHSVLDKTNGSFGSLENVKTYPLDDDKLILVDKLSAEDGSSRIGIYNTKTKQYTVERHVTVPMVLNYYKSRSRNN